MRNLLFYICGPHLNNFQRTSRLDMRNRIAQSSKSFAKQQILSRMRFLRTTTYKHATADYSPAARRKSRMSAHMAPHARSENSDATITACVETERTSIASRETVNRQSCATRIIRMNALTT